MFDSVVDVLGMLRPVVAELDPEAMDAEAAAQLVERFVEVEQLAAAGRVLATQALEQSVVWRREGFRSAAAWMASKAGTSGTGASARAATRGRGRPGRRRASLGPPDRRRDRRGRGGGQGPLVDVVEPEGLAESLPD